MERNIVHLDMDAFYASVEQLDNSDLKGKPVIVGGISERSVVSTCSYEARRYGVHSAMPFFIAKKKCPHGIFLPVRHKRYKQVSREIFKIFREYTPLVEPLSIDEAFLDVTNYKAPPIKIAKEIKRKILEDIGLVVSAGISYNKFLAKIASSWNKPDGLFEIIPDMVPRILFPLKVNKVYGIGGKAAEKLNSVGIFTIKDLYTLEQKRMEELFGKQGKEIYDRIRGIDDRPVISHRDIKSIGRELTLDKDTKDKDFIRKMVFEFCKEISRTLNRKNLYGRTVTLKIKTSSFRTMTRSKTVEEYIRDIHELYEIVDKIIQEIEFRENIRLIGVSVSNLAQHPVKQVSMFEKQNANRLKKIDELVLDINEKMGDDTLKFGIEL